MKTNKQHMKQTYIIKLISLRVFDGHFVFDVNGKAQIQREQMRNGE